MTTPEAAVAALVGVLRARLAAAVPGARVVDEDPADEAETLPAAGQVAVFLEDRGVAQDVNGVGPWWRETSVRIEAMVQGPDAPTRRLRLRALLDAIEAGLNADRTLGGVVEALSVEAFDPALVEVPGAEDVAIEVVSVALEYPAATEL